MYEKGHITSFNHIFQFIPKTPVSKDLGIKLSRFNKLMQNVERFTLQEIALVAKYFEMDLTIMIELWRKEYDKQKNTVSIDSYKEMRS